MSFCLGPVDDVFLPWTMLQAHLPMMHSFLVSLQNKSTHHVNCFDVSFSSHLLIILSPWYLQESANHVSLVWSLCKQISRSSFLWLSFGKRIKLFSFLLLTFVKQIYQPCFLLEFLVKLIYLSCLQS